MNSWFRASLSIVFAIALYYVYAFLHEIGHAVLILLMGFDITSINYFRYVEFTIPKGQESSLAYILAVSGGVIGSAIVTTILYAYAKYKNSAMLSYVVFVLSVLNLICINSFTVLTTGDMGKILIANIYVATLLIMGVNIVSLELALATFPRSIQFLRDMGKRVFSLPQIIFGNTIRADRILMITIIPLILLVVCVFPACADNDDSILYGITDDSLMVYDPNLNTIGSYYIGSNLDDLATIYSYVFVVSHDPDNDVFLNVITSSNYQVIKRIPLLSGMSGANWVVSDNGQYVYVGNTQSRKVLKIDWISGVIVKEFTSPNTPYAMAISPDKETIYLACYGNITALSKDLVYLEHRLITGLTPVDIDVTDNELFFVTGSSAFCHGYIQLPISTGTYSNGTETAGKWPKTVLSHAGIDSYYVVYYNNVSLWDSGAALQFTPTTGFSLDMVISNDGTILYIAKSTDSSGERLFTIERFATNKSLGSLGSFTTPGMIEKLCMGYKYTGTKLVEFRTKTAYATLSVSGVNVTVYDSNDHLIYNSYTDDGGIVAFLLDSTMQYKILFNQSPNINQWYNITPSQSSYLISIPFDQVIGLTSWSDVIMPATGSIVSRYSIDHPFNSSTGAGWMNATFDDTAGLTDSVGFFLYQNGSDVGDDDVLINSLLDSSTPFVCNFSLPQASGNSYQIIILANQTGGGQYTYTEGLGHTFPGAKWLGGILPLTWYFWIAFGIVLILFSVGTISKKGLFGIFGAVAGWLFTIGGWFSLYLPDLAAYSACGVIFILSIVMFFVEREKYT